MRMTPSTEFHVTNEGWLTLNKDINRTRAVEIGGRLDWDRSLLDFILPYIHPGDVVVDAGASIGDHTIAFKEAVSPDGIVIAYEPNPIAYTCLMYNCYDKNVLC